jgi:WD40 repeat protein
MSFFLLITSQLRPLQTIQRTGNITQALWHPSDANLISLLGEEKLVEIWDVRGQFSPACSLPSHLWTANRSVSKINSLANNINASWSPNGDYIALGNKVALSRFLP